MFRLIAAGALFLLSLMVVVPATPATVRPKPSPTGMESSLGSVTTTGVAAVAEPARVVPGIAGDGFGREVDAGPRQG